MTLKKHLATLLLASALVSVSCAAKSPKQDTVSPDQSIAAAEAARKKAASVGGEWRDTGKLIKKARAAAEKGENEKAVKLAKEARKQAELGYQQAMDQKNAGIPAYMKK